MTPRQQAQNCVLIMAGGTGGHVFPALAVAARLAAAGVHVEWLGTQAGIESKLVVKHGIPITYISVAGLRGKGVPSLLLAPFKLLHSIYQSARAISRLQPACVLGMGGFASGPGGMAAWLLRKPLVIHEQNAVAGLTNRILARLARRVFVAFPDAFGDRKASCVGNPLRESLLHLATPTQRMANRQGSVRVLVLGGSLGAQALNETVPQALALMDTQARPEIWHQAGERKHAAALACYESLGVEARVVAFIDDMEEAYQWADLIICRAGALTVSEIASVGLASILVPYPHAVDDHQTLNARFLERAGAAVIVPEPELTPTRLRDLVIEMGNRDRLLTMAMSAYGAAQRDAAEQVANYCMEICHV